MLPPFAGALRRRAHSECVRNLDRSRLANGLQTTPKPLGTGGHRGNGDHVFLRFLCVLLFKNAEHIWGRTNVHHARLRNRCAIRLTRRPRRCEQTSFAPLRPGVFALKRRPRKTQRRREPAKQNSVILVARVRPPNDSIPHVRETAATRRTACKRSVVPPLERLLGRCVLTATKSLSKIMPRPHQ